MLVRGQCCGRGALEKTASCYGNVAVGFLMIVCTVEGYAGSSLD